MNLGKALLGNLGSNVPTEAGTPFGGGYYAGRVLDGGVVYAIIVAPTSRTGTYSWQYSGSTAGTSNRVSGVSNTNILVAGNQNAANFCRSYTGGGYNDWYLPAIDELEVCYHYLKPTTTWNYGGGTNTNAVPATPVYTISNPAQTTIPLFQNNGGENFSAANYWSSTENNANSAWMLNFDDGMQSALGGNKDTITRVRPIRRVRV